MNEISKCLALLVLPVALLIATGCAKKNDSTVNLPDGASTSEVAASMLTEAVNTDGNGSSLAFNEIKRAGKLEELKSLFGETESWASSRAACPTWLTTDGVGCTNGTATDGSGDPVLTLHFSNCSFGSSSAVWSGTLGLQIHGVSGATPACGDHIFTRLNANANSTLTHYFGASTTRTGVGGLVLGFDDVTGSGYSSSVSGGAELAFDSSNSRVVQIFGKHFTGTYATHLLWDHSVSSGALNIAITNGGTANETKTIGSGSVTVQHNILQTTGTSTITTPVVLTTDCACSPTSGVIHTSFSGGSLAGKSETLTFSACGQATLVNTSGATSTLTLAGCD